MNGLDDQRLNPLCELKQADMDLRHHTNNACQETFTPPLREEAEEHRVEESHGQVKGENQGCKRQ